MALKKNNKITDLVLDRSSVFQYKQLGYRNICYKMLLVILYKIYFAQYMHILFCEYYKGYLFVHLTPSHLCSCT